MAAVFIVGVLLWICGAGIVLAPLFGPATRELAAEVRTVARLLHHLHHRNDQR